MYDFLRVEFSTDKKSGKVTLNQVGLTKKVLKILGMLDINNNINPAATITLGTDADGPPFDEPWGYDSVVGMLICISRNSRSDIHFAVHQCARFTHNPRSIHAESVKSI